MTRTFVTMSIAIALLTTLVLPAAADDPIENGLAYLATQQQVDGGFTNGFSEGSDLGTTCDVILAIVAAGQDPATWSSSDGQSPLDYLAAQVESGTVELIGLHAKIALVLISVGLDPTDFAGHDLLADLNAAYDASTGSYGSSVVDQALIILALTHAGQEAPAQAVSYLANDQSADGGWTLFGAATDGVPDTNTTALAIQALLAAGQSDAVAPAIDYLQRVQNQDGGFPYQNPSDYGTDTDANSTAYVLQALLAAGESLADWQPGGQDPQAALNTLYDPQSGGFFWQAAMPMPNVLATAQAIPALQGYTFATMPQLSAAPVAPAPVTQPATPAPVLPASGGQANAPLAFVLAGLLAVTAGLALHRK